MLAGYAEPKKKGKILKCFSICFLYGYYDYAAEIFTQFKYLFSEQERRSVEQFMKKQIRLSYYFPNFKGRKFFANLIFGFWNMIMPTHHNWAISDKDLGNI